MAIKNNEMSSLRWYGENDTLEIGPFKLKGPMVYGATDDEEEEPSAVIVPRIFQVPQFKGSEEEEFHIFSYYYSSSYRRLRAAKRWYYLQWLQQGRPQTTNMVFLSLFLQGVERRLLVDRSDAKLIWDELWRLYPENGDSWNPVRDKIRELQWLLLLQVGDHARSKEIAALARETESLNSWDDESRSQLSLLLRWSFQVYGKLPHWLAFYCGRIYSGTWLGGVFKWAEQEMLQLFVSRIKQWDQSRLQLRLPPKAQCCFEYEPLNSMLSTTVLHWHDALRVNSQWKSLGKELAALFNWCLEELRPFGVALGKEGVTRQSRLAWEVLPAELKQGPHPSRAKLLGLGGELLEQTGYATTTVGQVAVALEIAERPSLTPVLSKVLAQSLQFCEFAVEPDARLSGKSYRWDEPLVFFSASTDKLGVFNEATALRYQSYAAFIRYALFIAQAAGEVRQETLTFIAQRLFQVFDLQPMEKRRARVLANQLVRQEISLKGYRPPEPAQDKLREHLPPLLLEIVRRNGLVSAAEESALATMWKRLGLEKKALTRELDALSASGVVFVGNMVPGRPGEKLPPPPPGASPTVVFELDHALIGELLEDTAHVHRTLHEAMGVEEEAGSLNAEGASGEFAEHEAPAQVVVTYVGLTSTLDGFLTALLQQPKWEKAAAQELARSYDTMLAGAVEKINDWSFEKWDEQLIYDDGDVLSVELGLIAEEARV